MTTRTQYSQEEKLQMVNEFAKSGLTKWSFVQKHPEYKRTTLLNWLSKYFPNTASEEEQQATADGTKDPKDSIGKFQMVVETARMNEVELGAYCGSNGIYATELNAWKVNCMNANNQG